MTIKLLHQCGHNNNWNRNSFDEQNVGDGLIISPVHTARHTVCALSEPIRNASLFDPQYYLPSSQKQKLNSYEFFPESIADGFQTNTFSLHALESAKLCVDFQIEQGFRAIVIPTRFYDQMVSDYRDLQEVYTVQPFVEAIVDSGTDLPVYVSLVLTSHMIGDEQFRTNILNWITSYQRIDGIYLVPVCDRSTKQIDDSDYLEQMLVMLHELRDIGLDVILGYQNTEGLLMTIVSDVEITFGSFENTRMFSLDKFLESSEERRGPRARIYLPGLLNWIQLRQAKEIRDSAPEIWEMIYVPTDQSEQALAAPVEPYFNQPQLYTHFFSVYEEQVRELEPLNPLDRYELLRTRIKQAKSHYETLDQQRVELEKHGRGDFLDAWLSAINAHWRNYMKPAS